MLSVVTCGTGNQKPETYVLVPPPPNNAADVGELGLQHLYHGIMGSRFPDGGLLRYRK